MKIALEACVSYETARKAYAGDRVGDNSMLRIKQAAEKLGHQLPPQPADEVRDGNA